MKLLELQEIARMGLMQYDQATTDYMVRRLHEMGMATRQRARILNLAARRQYPSKKDYRRAQVLASRRFIRFRSDDKNAVGMPRLELVEPVV